MQPILTNKRKNNLLYHYQVACSIDRLDNVLVKQAGTESIAKTRPRNHLINMLSEAAKVTFLPLGTHCHCWAHKATIGFVMQLYSVINHHHCHEWFCNLFLQLSITNLRSKASSEDLIGQVQGTCLCHGWEEAVFVSLGLFICIRNISFHQELRQRIFFPKLNKCSESWYK